MIILGPPRCKAHSRYQIKRKPRGTCESCWRSWIFKKYKVAWSVMHSPSRVLQGARQS